MKTTLNLLKICIICIFLSSNVTAQSFGFVMPNTQFVLIPGGGFETRAMVTSAPGQEVVLKAFAPAGMFASFQPDRVTGSQTVYLVVISTDSSLVQSQYLSISARQGSDSLVRNIHIMNANDGHGFYTIDRARDIMDTGFVFLSASHPQQRDLLDSLHRLPWLGCFPYPPLLVVTHHLFVRQQWRAEVLWHEMIPPWDWTKFFVYNESLGICWGVEIDTYGTFHCIPCDPTHYVFQDTLTSERDIEPGRSYLVYPNPTDGQLFVQAPEAQGATDVIIYDMSGKVVFRDVVDLIGRTSAIDLSALTKGMYIMVLESKDDRTRLKLMIQ